MYKNCSVRARAEMMRTTGKELRNMKEKYDELKMEVVAFEEGIWIATIDATAVSKGSGRQGGQNVLIDPTTGTAGYAP